jgi:hypothetical protein
MALGWVPAATYMVRAGISIISPAFRHLPSASSCRSNFTAARAPVSDAISSTGFWHSMILTPSSRHLITSS